MSTERGADLATFLEAAFPGVRLEPGGYERLPHLRFELGDEVPAEEASRRAAQAAQRAATLFEASFRPEENGFVYFRRWREEDDDHLEEILPPDAADRVERAEAPESDVAVPALAFTVALKPRSLDYRRLFLLIANSELGENPAVGARAYLLNRTRPLLFHMYDDRGAIVVAPSEDRVRALRESFDGWLVRG